MRRPVATMTLLAAVAFGAGCAGSSPGNVAPEPKGRQADDTGLVTGRRIYVADCQRCHAPRGQGLTGPRLAGVVTRSFPDIQNEINIVANGANAMPGWNDRLTAAEIRAVVRYTREVL